MIYSIIFLAASAATVAAQGYSYDASTGVYTCDLNPNGAYCAGDSLSSPIIIRCANGVGQPGNCNDNTAGYYPYGDVGDSLCYQTSDTSGDAACEKNCIVEGATGNYDGTLTLPGCTPAVPSTSASSSASSTAVTVSPTTTSTAASSSTTITSTGTTTYTMGGVTTTEIFTFTTVVCPATSTTPVATLSTSVTIPLSTGGSTPPSSPVGSSGMSNGTVAATSKASGSATATPVGPTTSSTPLTVVTGSGMANSAGAGLAAIGVLIAYFM